MEVKLSAGDLLPPNGASKSPAESLIYTSSRRWANNLSLPARGFCDVWHCAMCVLLGYGLTRTP